MDRARLRRFVIVAAVIGVCFFIAKRMFWLPALDAHQGDGAFANISSRAGPFAIPGYSITLPEFDLAAPFEAEYRLSELPSIDRRCMVYFAFRDPDDKCGDSRAMNHGKIHLELLDGQGSELIRVSGSPSEFIWYGSRDMHGLYQMHRSSLWPDPSEKYTIRVSYDPEPALAPFKGYVFLECGGHL
jgi:hypothetical protein